MCSWAVFDGNFCKKHLIHICVRLFEIVLLLLLIIIIIIIIIVVVVVVVVVAIMSWYCGRCSF